MIGGNKKTEACGARLPSRHETEKPRQIRAEIKKGGVAPRNAAGLASGKTPAGIRKPSQLHVHAGDVQIAPADAGATAAPDKVVVGGNAVSRVVKPHRIVGAPAEEGAWMGNGHLPGKKRKRPGKECPRPGRLLVEHPDRNRDRAEGGVVPKGLPDLRKGERP